MDYIFTLCISYYEGIMFCRHDLSWLADILSWPQNLILIYHNPRMSQSKKINFHGPLTHFNDLGIEFCVSWPQTSQPKTLSSCISQFFATHIYYSSIHPLHTLEMALSCSSRYSNIIHSSCDHSNSNIVLSFHFQELHLFLIQNYTRPNSYNTRDMQDT